MLYKVFIDESGQKEYVTRYSRDFITSPPNFEKYEDFWRNNYFVLAAVRVKQEDLGEVNSALNALKKEYFKTHKVEIKSDWLRNPYQRKKRYLDPFRISPENLNECGERFIDLIAHYKDKVKIISVVFDKRYYGDAKRSTPEGIPLLKTTQVLFERLQYAGNYQIVVFDQMESSLKLSVGQHKTILQVFQENAGKDGKSKMGTYSYFDRIRCNFYFDPLAEQVRGYGFVCLPDLNKVNWNILEGCFSNKKFPPK